MNLISPSISPSHSSSTWLTADACQEEIPNQLRQYSLLFLYALLTWRELTRRNFSKAAFRLVREGRPESCFTRKPWQRGAMREIALDSGVVATKTTTLWPEHMQVVTRARR